MKKIERKMVEHIEEIIEDYRLCEGSSIARDIMVEMLSCIKMYQAVTGKHVIIKNDKLIEAKEEMN